MARINPSTFLVAAIALLIIGVVAANIGPTAIADFFTANQTGWGTATTTIFDLQPLMYALAYLMLPVAIVIKMVKDAE